MGGQGPFQLPIIERVNNMAMAAGHLDAGSVIDEPLSNSEDSVVLGSYYYGMLWLGSLRANNYGKRWLLVSMQPSVVSCPACRSPCVHASVHFTRWWSHIKKEMASLRA